MMTTSTAMPLRFFQLGSASFGSLGTISVSVVQSGSAAATADAFVDARVYHNYRGGPAAPQNIGNFEDARIVERPDDRKGTYVAVTRTANDSYDGVYVFNRAYGEPNILSASRNRLAPRPGGAAAIAQTLNMAGSDGHASAFLDCTTCLGGVRPLRHNSSSPRWTPAFRYHQIISTIVAGIALFARGVSQHKLNASVNAIVLGMDEQSLAVWDEGSMMYLQSFEDRDRDIRVFVEGDRKREVDIASGLQAVDRFVRSANELVGHAHALEKLNSEFKAVAESLKRFSEMAEQERAPLEAELRGVRTMPLEG